MTSHLKQRIIIMITWIPLLSLNMKWERWMEHDDGCLHWNCDLWRVQVDDRVPPPFTLVSNQAIVNLSWSTTHSAHSSNSVTWIQQWMKVENIRPWPIVNNGSNDCWALRPQRLSQSGQRPKVAGLYGHSVSPRAGRDQKLLDCSTDWFRWEFVSCYYQDQWS
jgi:hypothetical protein